MPRVLHDEEHGDLQSNCVDRRERNRCRESEVLRHGVEEPDLRELDGKVRKEDERRALPLFLCGWDFLL